MAVFVVLIAISMASYPGGTWMDPHAAGHDLLRNFLCDLVGPVALNGEPNRLGSVAAPVAMVVLAGGLGLAWWLLPRFFPSLGASSTTSSRPARLRLTVAIRCCGLVSVLGLVAVPLTPPVEAYGLHAAAVFVGGLPGIAASVLSVLGLARRRPRLAWLGGVAVVLALVDGTLYTQQLIAGGVPTVFLPAIERLATLALLVWLVAIGLGARSLAREQSGQALEQLPP